MSEGERRYWPADAYLTLVLLPIAVGFFVSLLMGAWTACVIFSVLGLIAFILANLIF
jgi:hypothetical protein